MVRQSYNTKAAVEQTASRSAVAPSFLKGVRPKVKGKFIFIGDQKLYIRGVTYGPFHPDRDGNAYNDREVVARDFALMAAYGINSVRTYTVPPYWLLDIAQQHGIYVMVGLPWEQHVAFLEDKKCARSIENRVRVDVRTCAGHAAVLCYAIGNEIPASIVRWYGRRRVERFLERLYWAAKAEDSNGLVTYVNYPTTEYLQLPFVDFICFNVYLESQDRLAAYHSRLQIIADQRPLIMGEIGLDSRRHGEEAQAHVLDWQIRTTFAAGCAGAFVFAWTDEWYRGGYDIEDWDFGLTDRDRCPKPALTAIGRAYTEVPSPPDKPWPRISVVVCTHNGNRTIRECFEGLLTLDYPDFEVIVVDDGSTDATVATARDYGFRLILSENHGLSNARNLGLEAATGDIVAYIDDDAMPDPHWLTYLATTFLSTKHVGVGGPNIVPEWDGPIAHCVANAPGGPVHVLLSDQEAEHIPGCNMAFRKAALQAIGGFDPRFRAAGDDVDVCWRLQQKGWTLGFSPTAMVWHHRRNSVKAFWKQQFNYGRAEALLEMKWPEKYNTLGHLTWKGRLYSNGLIHRLLWFRRWRIYHGVWGSGLFQSIYETAPGTLLSLSLMPEWYLVIAALVGLSALGALWWPLFLALPLLAVAVGVPLIQAVWSAVHASFPSAPRPLADRLKLRSLTALLHVLQPLARLYGRLRYGLTPWRRPAKPNFAFPRSRTSTIWSEYWQAPEKRLESIEAALRKQGAVVMRGGDFDRWDLEVRGGLFGAVRARMAIEEHGAGKQLLRFRFWPRFSSLAIVLTFLFVALSTMAAIDQAGLASAIIGLVALGLMTRMFGDCGCAMASGLHVLRRMAEGVRPDVRHIAAERFDGTFTLSDQDGLEYERGE